jgi:hypothetical protein
LYGLRGIWRGHQAILWLRSSVRAGSNSRSKAESTFEQEQVVSPPES